MSFSSRLSAGLAVASALAFIVALNMSQAAARYVTIAGAALAIGAWILVERRLHTTLRRLSDLANDVQPEAGATGEKLGHYFEVLAARLEAARRAGQRLELILNGMADSVFVVTAEGKIRDSNAAATRLLGWTADALAGRDIQSLISVEQRHEFDLSRAAGESRDFIIETSSGAVLPASITGSRIAGSQELIFVIHDITDRRRAERRVSYLAKHDGLTRLPNRMQFKHLLQQALARAQRDGTLVALLYLDLDRFKEVNDTFGHSAGDRALEVLSERLAAQIPQGAVLGRLAGDEFSVFLPIAGTRDRPAVAALARDILTDVSRAFFLNDTEIYLTLSIGIAFSESPIDNTIDLVRSADVAMYHAKQSGGGTYAFYDPQMTAAAVERLVLKSKLRRSLELDELVTLYQPLVDLESGAIIGAEALLRWRLPGHGDIPPAEFIPLAEQSNLIHAIGEWVIRKVCTDFVTWRSAGVAPKRVAINLSMRQFSQPGTVDKIADILKAHDIAPSVFELEITESTLMEYERTGPVLESLAAQGFRIAIDDFGTGYSSLSALRQMPVQTLKIDQSFIRGLTENGDDTTLTRTIVEMGRNLGLEVVAEGIETPYQRQLLAMQGCHLGQGRLFGAPMTAGRFQERLVMEKPEAPPTIKFSA